jgi:carboxyl-terminal processing protease
MPDIFVSSDTSDITSYISQAVSKGLIRQYTFRYSDAHRKELSQFKNYETLLAHLKQQNILDSFTNYAAEKGLKARYWQLQRSKKRLEQSLYANIIYNTLGMLEHVRYINTFDTTVLKAVEVLESGNAFPKLTDADSRPTESKE